MAFIEFKNIYKVYNEKYLAIDNFNLDINNNEFIALIGPSGCGKSTLLRMIAGLEDITDGTLSIAGRCVNNVHSKDRDISMVFQNYALYPHMNVFDNIAFGLKLRKLPKKEIKEKVDEVAKVLGLTEQLEKTPSEMSGGQRQRVALGRAMVQDSKVFLMDEPLSNLDAKLRNKMRLEILKLHRQLGITTIYVTHDQVEAMTMADRIVVMNKGVIQQIGTPRDLYSNPENLFVATFIGEPEMNLIRGTINNDKFISDSLEVQLDSSKYSNLQEYDGKEVILGIRPEHIKIVENSNITSEIELTEMRGDIQILVSKIGNEEISAKTTSSIDIKIGQIINYEFDKSKILLFDAKTEARIGHMNICKIGQM